MAVAEWRGDNGCESYTSCQRNSDDADMDANVEKKIKKKF
jgi:hypothetical protein